MINLKEFTVDSISYLGWELGFEFEIALTNAGWGGGGMGVCELNFDKSFLYFNVKKKIYTKVTVNLIVNIGH